MTALFFILAGTYLVGVVLFYLLHFMAAGEATPWGLIVFWPIALAKGFIRPDKSVDRDTNG